MTAVGRKPEAVAVSEEAKVSGASTRPRSGFATPTSKPDGGLTLRAASQ